MCLKLAKNVVAKFAELLNVKNMVINFIDNLNPTSKAAMTSTLCQVAE